MHGCRGRFVLSVEEEAAQERRTATSIVRGTTRCSVEFEEALNPEGLYWSSGWLHNHFDLFRDRSARERQAWGRGFLSVEGGIRVKKGGGTRWELRKNKNANEASYTTLS